MVMSSIDSEGFVEGSTQGKEETILPIIAILQVSPILLYPYVDDMRANTQGQRDVSPRKYIAKKSGESVW